MHSVKVIWIVVFIIFGFIKYSSTNLLLDWFDWSIAHKQPSTSSPAKSDSSGQEIRDIEDITQISVPFEELAYEDKFLLEVEKINKISPSTLDRCEQKVIMKIQGSCSDLTEEELAKLSIRLLNCQSEISGRSQVLCTDTMKLKECISPMDTELWNAYHIINNRARAVCYAMRQQQFRALSEVAVNKLMSSTLSQITNMDSLQELQKQLNLLTADTVSSLRKGQLELLDHTGELQAAQSRARLSITNNIKHLALEQTLIQDTHNQLTLLSEKLAKQLDTQSTQFESVKDEQYRALEEILTSLSLITANTDALWNAIEKKSQQLLQQQEKIKKSNLETLENLKHINESLLYLVNLVTQLKTEVDRKIEWATGVIGGDGPLLISVLLNTLYLVIGVLVTLFLQLTLRYRVPLLVAVGTNVLLVYQRQSLTFLDLTVSIVGCWLVISLLPMCFVALKKYKSNSSKRSNMLQKEKQMHEENDDNASTRSSLRSDSVSENCDNPKRNSSFIGHRDTMIHNSFNGLHLRRSSSQSESGSQSLCVALCRNGQSCRSTPTPGRQFCRRHLPH